MLLNVQFRSTVDFKSLCIDKKKVKTKSTVDVAQTEFTCENIINYHFPFALRKIEKKENQRETTKKNH